MRSASDKLIRKMKTMKDTPAVLYTADSRNGTHRGTIHRAARKRRGGTDVGRYPTAGVCQNAGRGKIPRPADMHYGKRKCHSMAGNIGEMFPPTRFRICALASSR